jgi:hypothetical protein
MQRHRARRLRPAGAAAGRLAHQYQVPLLEELAHVELVLGRAAALHAPRQVDG